MAKNDISAAKAHLKLLGYIIIRFRPYYHFSNRNGEYASYQGGRWTSHNHTLTLLLQKLTIQPIRYNNQKLNKCEALIKTAGGKRDTSHNRWKVKEHYLTYYGHIKTWKRTGIKGQNEQLLQTLNKIMSN